METQSPVTSANQTIQPLSKTGAFSAGAVVIYGMHGKCSVVGIEARTIGADSIPFYKLEVQKSSLSRSTRQEPAIWVPVSTARERGLRSPISAAEVDSIMAILSSREYYFDASVPWAAAQSKIESAIRAEGGIGLAKAVSFLHVLKRKQLVPTPELTKMYEMISKLLFREISEVTGESIREIEERTNKVLRHKLIPDT